MLHDICDKFACNQTCQYFSIIQFGTMIWLPQIKVYDEPLATTGAGG